MALLWLLGGLACLILAGRLYQWRGERSDRRRFPMPGRLVNGLHLYQTGHGGPVIVLEAGIAASSVSWRMVQDRLSPHFTVVSYDRAGFAWSPPATTPRTIPNLVDELAGLLRASGLPGPYILVGHSFGGLMLRHFVSRYRDMTMALVLLDPLEPLEWHPATPPQLHRLGKGVMLSKRGATLARYGVVRLGLDLLMSGAHAIPKLLSKASSGQGSSVTDRLVGEIRKLPPDVWPVVKSHWCLPRSFTTMAQYLNLLPDSCALTMEDSALRDVPLAVLSSDRSNPEVIEAHRHTAGLSRLGVHTVARGCGHWVQLDQPDLVVEAVHVVTKLS
jgi:pimeloyl-ACP methyl ester carboxylesterase